MAPYRGLPIRSHPFPCSFRPPPLDTSHHCARGLSPLGTKQQQPPPARPQLAPATTPSASLLSPSLERAVLLAVTSPRHPSPAPLLTVPVNVTGC